jgi:hypothetical protein
VGGVLIKGKSYLISFTALFAEKEYTLTYNYYVPVEVNNQFPLSAPAISTWRAVIEDSERLGVRCSTVVGVFGKLLEEGTLSDVYAHEPEGMIPSTAVLRLVGHIHAAIQSEGRAKDIGNAQQLNSSNIVDRVVANAIKEITESRLKTDFRDVYNIDPEISSVMVEPALASVDSMERSNNDKTNVINIEDRLTAAKQAPVAEAQTVEVSPASPEPSYHVIEIAEFLKTRNRMDTLDTDGIEISLSEKKVEYTITDEPVDEAKKIKDIRDGEEAEVIAGSGERIKEVAIDDAVDPSLRIDDVEGNGDDMLDAAKVLRELVYNEVLETKRIEPDYKGDIVDSTGAFEKLKELAIGDTAAASEQTKQLEISDFADTEKKVYNIGDILDKPDARRIEPDYRGDITDEVAAHESRFRQVIVDDAAEGSESHVRRDIAIDDEVTADVSKQRLTIIDDGAAADRSQEHPIYSVDDTVDTTNISRDQVEIDIDDAVSALSDEGSEGEVGDGVEASASVQGREIHYEQVDSFESRKDLDQSVDKSVAAVSYSQEQGAVHLEDYVEGIAGGMTDIDIDDKQKGSLDKTFTSVIDDVADGKLTIAQDSVIEDTDAATSYSDGEATVEQIDKGGAELVHEVFNRPEVMTVMRLAEILHGKQVVEEIMLGAENLLETMLDNSGQSLAEYKNELLGIKDDGTTKGDRLDRHEGVLDGAESADQRLTTEAVIGDQSIAETRASGDVEIEEYIQTEAYGGSGGVVEQPSEADLRVERVVEMEGHDQAIYDQQYDVRMETPETSETRASSEVIMESPDKAASGLSEYVVLEQPGKATYDLSHDVEMEGHDKADYDATWEAAIETHDGATYSNVKDSVIESPDKATYDHVVDSINESSEVSEPSERTDAVIDYVGGSINSTANEVVVDEGTDSADSVVTRESTVDGLEAATTQVENGAVLENLEGSTTYSSGGEFIDDVSEGSRKKRINDLQTSTSDGANRLKPSTDTMVGGSEPATRIKPSLDTVVAEDSAADRHKVLDTVVHEDDTALLDLKPEPKKAKRIWLILGRIASWNIWNWRKTR